MRIHNIEQLASYVGVPSCFEGDYERAVERAVYKYTECGCVFSAMPEYVVVAGYAEGADAECEGHVLTYPFDGQDWDAALAEADADGCAMFYEWNADECPRCKEIELRCTDEEIDDARDECVMTYECSACGHLETHVAGLPSWYLHCTEDTP